MATTNKTLLELILTKIETIVDTVDLGSHATGLHSFAGQLLSGRVPGCSKQRFAKIRRMMDLSEMLHFAPPPPPLEF